jgi:hypothetical protein
MKERQKEEWNWCQDDEENVSSYCLTLRKRDGSGNWKGRHCIPLCGDFTLKKATDLSYNGIGDERDSLSIDSVQFRLNVFLKYRYGGNKMFWEFCKEYYSTNDSLLGYKFGFYFSEHSYEHQKTFNDRIQCNESKIIVLTVPAVKPGNLMQWFMFFKVWKSE